MPSCGIDVCRRIAHTLSDLDGVRARLADDADSDHALAIGLTNPWNPRERSDLGYVVNANLVPDNQRADVFLAGDRSICARTSCWSPVRKLPAGTSSGAARNTSVTSATVRPWLVKRSGSRMTLNTRCRAPKSGTSATPGREIKRGTISCSIN